MSAFPAGTARRWLAWIALALGIGAAAIGAPAHRPAAAHAPRATVIRGC